MNFNPLTILAECTTVTDGQTPLPYIRRNRRHRRCRL